MNKFMRYLFFVTLVVFVFTFALCLSAFFVESFTYSGFIIKHFNFNPTYLMSIFVYIGLSMCVLYFALIKNDPFGLIITFWLKINTMLFIILATMVWIVNLVEFLTYPNFIYSRLHIQPHLLTIPLYVWGIMLVINFCLYMKRFKYKKRVILKKVFKLVQKIAKIIFKYKLPIIPASIVKKVILSLYTFGLLIFTIYNSTTFIPNFYKVDRTWKQENELKYFLGDMDIYKWISESLPRTKEIIYWCGMQNKPVDLVSFDPEIIWLSYDALSRVFLTNCQYVNINPVSRSYDYFDKEELLLVSVSKCDPLLTTVESNSENEIMSRFKLINNEYICKSREILPNLYLYKK